MTQTVQSPRGRKNVQWERDKGEESSRVAGGSRKESGRKLGQGDNLITVARKNTAARCNLVTTGK